jgi:hypothetical protein
MTHPRGPLGGRFEFFFKAAAHSRLGFSPLPHVPSRLLPALALLAAAALPGQVLIDEHFYSIAGSGLPPGWSLQSGSTTANAGLLTLHSACVELPPPPGGTFSRAADLVVEAKVRIHDGGIGDFNLWGLYDSLPNCHNGPQNGYWTGWYPRTSDNPDDWLHRMQNYTPVNRALTPGRILPHRWFLARLEISRDGAIRQYIDGMLVQSINDPTLAAGRITLRSWQGVDLDWVNVHRGLYRSDGLVFLRAANVWMMNTDGTGQRQLTSTGNANTPRLSNGVVVYRANGQLYKMDAYATVPPQPIPDTAGVLEYDVDPTGTKLVITYQNNSDLYVMNIDGTGRTRIHGAPNTHMILMNWGRDGYMYFSQSQFGNAYSQRPFRMPLNGSSPPVQLVTDFSQWATEGGTAGKAGYVAPVSDPDRTIYLMNANGTGHTAIPGLQTGVNGYFGFDYEVDVIYYALGWAGRNEVWRANTEGEVHARIATNVDGSHGVDYGKLPPPPVADDTPPLISAQISGPLGNEGWYRGPVAITWTVTDPESNIDTSNGCGPVTVSADTAGLTLTCTATSAGGSATQSVTVKVDATAPTIAQQPRTPAANAAGWNNSDVTANWSCADALSGTVSGAVSQTVTAQGAALSATGQCQDRAGNSASHTQTGIRIDKGSPVLTAVRAPSPNPAGWNNAPVTVDFSCADALSGVVSLNPAQAVFTTDSATHAVSGLCLDAAGNQAALAVNGIQVDRTAPTATLDAVTPDVVPAGAPFQLLATAADALSGVAAVSYNAGPATGALTLSGAQWSAQVPALAVGVYDVCVNAADHAGNTSAASCRLVPVYDPAEGFVTGGGWIQSPAGAYTADPSLTGKATFGFVSRYKPGANTPSGDTQFQFHAAGLNFKSTAYDWLVVAGARAQYKGTGTINGAGAYPFLLTAIDGDLNGTPGPDRFRLKIWAAGGIVYDNQMNASDTADPTTALGGGSIVVHKK